MANRTKILQLGAPLLREQIPLVEDLTDDLTQNSVFKISNYFPLTKAYAIAANQMGYSVRLFVWERNNKRLAVINPSVEWASEDHTVMLEGCLSLAGIQMPVIRPDKVTVRYTKLDGEVVYETLEGLEAKIFQHELDHLNGKLIIDYQDETNKEKIMNKLKKVR